ncbi:exonuclease subunit SbcD [Bifidobacterium sp. LC6]|uniref:Nuclease SbcCD subunit D n=1 Tax=Bifidobacterium colobi TaxID=2809026 RepID=A0ABS5UZ95_9BIFI|nr:exonuclease SbcCD subunit D C-terminal domain-containing protein [Bifidobacterium colobi]MBT1175483.1 exonuclease subunit SbcD [Bifidobacterium colobi]
MRVLHTSDWHIGRRFKGVSLLEYQRNALAWLIELIQREHVEVLCVAGDVYDLSMPSSDAVRLFNEMFAQLGHVKVDGKPLEIIMTPGNHDSAVRLGAGAALMQPNIHMRCEIDGIAEPVLIERGNERLAVYALPYLDPDAARSQLQGMLDEHDIDYHIPRSHEGMMRAALELITRDIAQQRTRCPQLTALLMAHAFVSGAQSCDSERAITVGGLDSVPAELFSHSGLDYLALGHLHRPQRVSIPELPVEQSTFALDRTPQARYSGSLLAYSFSESLDPPQVGNGKSVVLFEATDAGVSGFDTVTVDSKEPPFAQLEGTLEEIQGNAAEHRNDWVSVNVHVSEFPQGLYQKIDSWYPHALEKNVIYDRTPGNERSTTIDLRNVTSEAEVLNRFVLDRLNREPDKAEQRVLQSTIERVRKQYAEYAGGNAVGAHDETMTDSDEGVLR